MDDLVEDCQATKVVIGPRSVAYQAFSDERRAAM
jgi:hypothetical protein